MNTTKAPPFHCCWRFILVALLPCFAWQALAGSLPQYAFSINSGQVPGGLYPFSLATDPAGNIYVSSLATIIKLAPNGSYLATWGGSGTGPGQFSYPGELAFDSQTNLYATDQYNDRVEKFAPDGRFLLSWGTTGTSPGQFNYPDGLAVSGSGNVYVADVNNNRLEEFNSLGGFLTQVLNAGAVGGAFGSPWVLSFDSSNNLYLVDLPSGYTNYRVLKLDQNGNYLAQWPAYGTTTVNFTQIGGIATDPANNVYVADAANNRVQKYASDGTFLGQWGSLGSGPGQFNSASGIAVDPSGNYVYVSDYYNGRIQVFAYSALAPLLYQQPTNQTLPAGATLTLNAGVFGAQPLSYQWRFNGADLPDATNATLQIPNAPLSASGTYLLLASNALGLAISSNAIIAVLPVVVTTLPASSITSTSAVLNASFTTGASPSAAWFDWGTDTNYGTILGSTGLVAYTNTHLTQFSTNLNGTIVYHFRAVGSNDLGLVYGADTQLQVGLKPVVATLPTAPVDTNSVTLQASVVPNGRDTRAYFRWGSSTLYGSYTPTNDLGSGVAPVLMQNQITGLRPGIIYHAQAIAVNDLGTTNGSDVLFIAPPWNLVSPAVVDWSCLAWSADATSILAAGPSAQPYLSTNSGVSWRSLALPPYLWHGVTLSADGTHLAAIAQVATYQPGPAYFSTNGGATWGLAAGPTRNWASLATSGDGTHLVAADPIAGLVLTSTNSGANWNTNTPPFSAAWSLVASSADGQTLVAAASGFGGLTNGPLYTSSNGGQSWISNNLPLQYWHALACSADGQTLIAAVGGGGLGPLFVSTNAGNSWFTSPFAPTNWQAVALSADGRSLAALLAGRSLVLVSTNLGTTWTSSLLPQAWNTTLATSADGAALLVAGDHNLFMLHTAPAPSLKTDLTDGQFGISWTIPSLPFHLEQAASLPNPLWMDVTNQPILDFGTIRWRVALPLAAPGGFYRLAAP